MAGFRISEAPYGIWLAVLVVALSEPATAFSSFATASPSTCAWTAHGSPYPLQAVDVGVCPAPGSRLSPWSHPPHCPEPDRKHLGGEIPTDCVFTFASFRGGQGISIITSPELAHSLAPFLDDASVPALFRDHPSSPQAPPPAERSARGEKGFAVRDLPGRGKGVIANRAFQKHEGVMTGFPVLFVRMDFLNSEHFSDAQQRKMLQRAANQLPPGRKAEVLALARSAGGEPIRDVIKTNAFGIELGGIQHLALFIEGSRVNHGCRPNTFWRYTDRHFAMEVVALRDIKPGEEIMHSYAPLGYTLAERREILKPWGFVCRCPLCTASPSEVSVSDERRERLFEIHATLRDPANLPGLSRARIDQLVREAMTLISLEELDPQLVEYYQLFARTYMAIGALKVARTYIAMAEAKWIYYDGVEHSNVDGIRELWQEWKEAEEEADED